MSRYGRPIFDQSATFVVRTGPLTVGSIVYAPGQVLATSNLSVRRLQQLFEQRKIEIVTNLALAQGSVPRAQVETLVAAEAVSDKARPKATSAKA